MGRGGGRGGNFNNNRGNNNGNNNNNRNGNRNGNSKYHCKACGPNHNHNTKDCWKSGAQNQNNKVNKKQKNQNNNSQNSKKVQCLQCGSFGHGIKTCTAKLLPEPCECGCQYHLPTNCPWNNDPFTFQQEASTARGKICQWCKNDGDGLHDYNDCKEPRNFRNLMMATILKEYNRLPWCWHCSSQNHKTQACDKTSADLPKTVWTSKIDAIIAEWTNKSPLHQLSPDHDMYIDHTEYMNGKPTAGLYVWCLYCQQFGHMSGKNLDGACDYTEYNIRCPVRTQGSATGATQPYMNPHQASPIVGMAVPNQQVQIAQPGNTLQHFLGSNAPLNPQEAQIMARCINTSCNNSLWFPRHAGKLGYTQFCTKCSVPNPHPTNGNRKDSTSLVIEAAIAGATKSLGELLGLKPKNKSINMLAWNEPSDIDSGKFKRPSHALSKHLATKSWPQTQPIYYDMTWDTSRVFMAPVFNKDQSDWLNLHLKPPKFPTDGNWIYFNRPGNFQEYFPATKFELQEDWIAAMGNDELTINKAGRRGLLLYCYTCRTEARVIDDEHDYVMCGNDVGSTAGCGGGYYFWLRRTCWDTENCDCIPGIDKPNWAWVAPRR